MSSPALPENFFHDWRRDASTEHCSKHTSELAAAIAIAAAFLANMTLFSVPA